MHVTEPWLQLQWKLEAVVLKSVEIAPLRQELELKSEALYHLKSSKLQVQVPAEKFVELRLTVGHLENESCGRAKKGDDGVDYDY